MASDKVTEALVEALRQARAEPTEQPLFRTAKLGGLFTGRGSGAEAAARALAEGLLEVVRTEARGKTTTEWVRLTPQGVDFLHAHESPLEALRELQALLQTTREGVPGFLADMRQQLAALGTRLSDDIARLLHRLDVLQERVEQALRRADAAGPALPNGIADAVPWALEALAYLDRRRTGGTPADCPLPELFAALRRRRQELSVTSFHDGLRRLAERRAVRLLPFAGPPGALPEPEFALLDGALVLYYVTR
jgi:hypothetical protein